MESTEHPPRVRRYTGIRGLFPERNDGLCACGCGSQLPERKRRWSSEECLQSALGRYYVWKGDSAYIRQLLLDRDKAVCAKCRTVDEKWQADHIVAVVNGGGCCDLDGYQTLCLECHKKKTIEDVRLYRSRK